MQAAMEVHLDAQKCSEFQSQQAPKQAPDFAVPRSFLLSSTEIRHRPASGCTRPIAAK
jgi:hypothetical protein